MSDVRTTLESLGYSLTRDGVNYFRAAALYRSGDNPTSLRINSKTGRFIDFVENKTGSIYDLVQLTLGLKNYNEAKNWLDNNKFSIQQYNKTPSNPLIEDAVQSYPIEILNKLVPCHDYWIKRGVSEQTLQKYKGGIALNGSMAQRYVFPIFDSNDRIIGFAGRDLTGTRQKWKLVAPKKNCVFPAANHENIRTQREVILVESIGDHLALEEAGIHNSLVVFGVNLSDTILSRLVGLNPEKIIIALNNDSQKNNVGQIAAEKIKERLLNFFDSSSVIVALPETAKDFGEMRIEQIKEWYGKVTGS